MSDFLKSINDSIEEDTPKAPVEPENEPKEAITAETVADMIEQALKSNDTKIRSLVEEAISKNIDKLANYKPEEPPADKIEED